MLYEVITNAPNMGFSSNCAMACLLFYKNETIVQKNKYKAGFTINVITSYSIHYTKLYESDLRPLKGRALQR